MAAPNTARQREDRQRLRKLFIAPQMTFIVHYACQSFDRSDQSGSPRVAAIAVRNLFSGTTESFSFHQELDLSRGRALADDCERALLGKFFKFLEAQKTMQFVHWNMRDLTFGFPALEHRFEVLGGKAFQLQDSQKTDLAMMLTHIYGNDYLPRPHFETLAHRNKLSLEGFVPGKHEPTLFLQGQHREILRSTLCKVRLMSDIAQLAHDGTLRTDATWWIRNVGRAREAYELFHDNPVYAWGGLLLSGIVGGWSLVSKWF